MLSLNQQATKTNVDDFPTFFVYVCIEKRQRQENLPVGF